MKKKPDEHHGMSRSIEYRHWDNMIARCERPTNPYYHRYGGRGIKVDPLWRQSFAAFFKDIGAKPHSKCSIDRIDPDGNYEPGNVRWATPAQQNHNIGLRKNNRSGFTGVCWESRFEHWRAYVTVAGQQFDVGRYDDPLEAAYIRDQFALALLGESVRLNVL